jgi:hypothetical protein
MFNIINKYTKKKLIYTSMKHIRKFTEAVKTECQTPEANYNIEINTDKVSVEVELPELDLTEEEAKLLESNIHNAMELVLAPYFLK